MSSRQQHVLAELRAALLGDAGRVAEKLLGEPNRRLSSRRTLRFGSNGSVAVEISGTRAGLYFNHEAGEGGDLLDLVQRTLRLTFVEAVAWAEAATGTSSSAARVAITPASLQRELAEREAARQADAALEDAAAIARAAAIWDEALPVAAGSRGDIYLNATRAISRPAAGWPSVVRWHPVRSALVFAATTPDGTVAAAQRIYVTPNGQKLSHAELIRRGLPKAKLTSGRPSHGAVVRLPGSRPGPLLLVEGPEDGLTAWTATGCETWITLGFMGADSVGRQLPDDRPTVVIRDGDAPESPAAKALDAAVSRWREVGRDVREVYARDDRAAAKYDINDLLREHGIDAVRARIDAALGIYRPRHRLPTLSRDEARARVQQEVEDFFGSAAAWIGRPDGDEALPLHHLVRAMVGLGKTHAVIAALREFIERQKASGLPHRVRFLVPSHRLGREVVANMEAAGLAAALFVGREAVMPETGAAACMDTDAVRDAIKVGADVGAAICGSADPAGPRCAFRSECGYFRQMAHLQEADIVVAAHHGAFSPLPAAAGKFALTIIDESFWQTGLLVRELRAPGFAETVLRWPVLADGLACIDDTDLLHSAAAKLETVMRSVPAGSFITAAALAATGLTAGDCRRAAGLEWRRKVDHVIHPGMPARWRAEAMRKAAGNAEISRRAAMWTICADILSAIPGTSGRLQVIERGDAEGSAAVVVVHERREIRDEVAGAPVLMLDGSADLEITREFLPNVTACDPITARAPHARVHQIVGPFGKTSLVPDKKAEPDENRRRENRIQDLRLHVSLLGGSAPAVIVYAKIEDRFAGPGIVTGHHGAVAGLNVMQHATALFVIGRPFADASDVRRDALCLFGEAIDYQEAAPQDGVALLEDGAGAVVRCRIYADPSLETVKRAITEAGLVQAMGRARALNRTAADPVDIFVYAKGELPVPVDAVHAWKDVQPTRIDAMAARGVIFLSAPDAFAAYGGSRQE